MDGTVWVDNGRYNRSAIGQKLTYEGRMGNSTGLELTDAKHMKVVTTRDSVAMGDDVDAPHEQRFSFPDSTSVEQAIDQIVKSGYLASVQGGATWSAVSRVPVAVVAQTWTQSRPVSWRPQEPRALKVEGGSIRLHFNYNAQIDPEIVLEVLKRLKLDYS